MSRKKASKKKKLTRAELDYLLDEVELDREVVYRHGLKGFVKVAWPLVEPNDHLIWNWHHDAICQHVEAVLKGELRNLLINVPPGFTKSMICSVLTTAYAWIANPGYRVLAIAHRDNLARRDSRKVRNLVLGQWYQKRWPLKLVKEDESRLENGKGGFRIIGSVRSGVIGERGNLLIVDDPLSREHAESEAERQATSEFFWETLPTRLSDFKKDGKIVIMQRLHQRDTAGEILERGGWETLILPNEFEPARRCVTSLGFTDPRKEEGELLHPERFDREATEEMKADLEFGGSRVYAGQYQQSPVAREGNLIKTEWLEHRFRVRGSKPKQIVQSWDCASKAKERNDPTACLTFAVFADHVELWDASTKRQEFPALKRRAIDKYEEFRPNVVLIEDKDAGQQLGQVLKAETKIPVKMINPGTLDKETRMDAESPFLEAGKLWLPEGAPWVSAYVDELTTFPAGAHDDQVDATSQFLKWHREQKKRASKAMPGGPSGSSTWI